MPAKVVSMRDAIADLVRDGDTVAIEGFTHLIGFAAGHEIIRQRKRDLTLARMTPDLIYDQMIAGGVARKLVFSWLGNPGVGGLNAIRRRIEHASVGEGTPLEIEEYSHFGMVARYTAGAANLPFMPLRSYFETDLPEANPLIRPIRSPYSDETVYAYRRSTRRQVIQPACRRRRQHPHLGPARLPEGGGVRCRPGDRGGRGAGGRGGDPRRPEPDGDPGPDRGRGGGRAVRRPSLVRPGRL
jgi:acyl CoA:acetate/3-ketoacid CoA transferase alpha subunit